MKLILLAFCSLFCYKKPIILSCCSLFCYMKPIILPFCSLFCYMKPIVRGGRHKYFHYFPYRIFVALLGCRNKCGAAGVAETKWVGFAPPLVVRPKAST